MRIIIPYRTNIGKALAHTFPPDCWKYFVEISQHHTFITQFRFSEKENVKQMIFLCKVEEWSSIARQAILKLAALN